MAEHLCPKCGGKLFYDAADRLFVCEACGNRYYREVILGASPKNDDLRVYCAPQASGGGEVELSSQYVRETPPEVPPPSVPSERVGANTVPKPATVTRRTQRYMARYDREREKKERDRLEAEAESRLWEETLSEGMRRANRKAIGTPVTEAEEQHPAPAPLARVAAPVGGVTLPTQEIPTEEVAAEETMPTRARLELALDNAQLTLREKQQTLKRLSSDIWRLERAPGQSAREFKQVLAEANREIDRAELAVKEAKLAVKEAKRNLKKAK